MTLRRIDCGEAALGLGQQVTPQQPEQGLDLRVRPVPVVGGEGVQSERADAAPGGGAYHRIHGARAGAMAGGARLRLRLLAQRPLPSMMIATCMCRVLCIAELWAKKYQPPRVALMTAST